MNVFLIQIVDTDNRACGYFATSYIVEIIFNNMAEVSIGIANGDLITKRVKQFKVNGVELFAGYKKEEIKSEDLEMVKGDREFRNTI